MKRKSLFIFILITLLQIIIAAVVMVFHTYHRPDYSMQKRIAAKLHLTDLCLTTESRHTRNIAFPLELTAPFQDIPGFFDHFPSSTFIRPQKTIINDNEAGK